MSSRSTRLRKAADRMTPVQIVLAHLEEGRRAGSFVAFGALVASRPYGPERTISAQAERSVRQHLEGQRKEVVESAVREAVAETLFLHKLAFNCMVVVVQTHREWFFRRALLHEYLLAAIEGRPGHDLRKTAGAVWAHEFDLCRTADAIRRISDVHFQGVDVLMPRERACLEEELEGVGRWTAIMRTDRKLRPGPDIPPWGPAGARMADEWCRLARSEVHWRFGRTREAMAELDPLVLRQCREEGPRTSEGVA